MDEQWARVESLREYSAAAFGGGEGGRCASLKQRLREAAARAIAETRGARPQAPACETGSRPAASPDLTSRFDQPI